AGEPAGSAGLPMLNVLRSGKMENALVFVIRYFGGTKLGKRGLMASLWSGSGQGRGGG
nr:YigZ family protein [Candidatus Neomarinimicrobiota bacterium]